MKIVYTGWPELWQVPPGPGTLTDHIMFVWMNLDKTGQHLQNLQIDHFRQKVQFHTRLITWSIRYQLLSFQPPATAAPERE